MPYPSELWFIWLKFSIRQYNAGIRRTRRVRGICDGRSLVVSVKILLSSLFTAILMCCIVVDIGYDLLFDFEVIGDLG